jgi:transposase InsO family protein
MAAPAIGVANALRRQFVATRPTQTWAGDITDVPTRPGWLYIAVLMDLYSRRIVGWAMDDQATTTLTLSALERALQQRALPVGLLQHSDRGSQYGAVAYQHRLAACGIQCSMSRPGNCWDNAVVESFFATLKTELLVNAHPYPTRRTFAPRSLSMWRGFTIGPAAIPPWAISAPGSSNSGRLSQPAVSTKPGEVQGLREIRTLVGIGWSGWS